MTQKNPSNPMKYWNITLLFSLFFMLFSIFGCSPKIVTKTNREVLKDSVSYTVNYIKKDTLIQIKGDTIVTSVPIYKLSEIPTVTKTDRGNLIISKVNDTIYAKCEINDLKHKLTLLEKEIKSFKSLLSINKTDTEVEVRYIPPFVKILAITGLLFIILLLLMFYLNFKK